MTSAYRWGCVLLIVVMQIDLWSVREVQGADSNRQVTAAFDADPSWESFRNQLSPPRRPTVRQDFGYRNSNFAGGAGPGEVGGTIHRAYPRAYHAKKITTRTLEDRLSASGKFSVTRADGGSGVLVGWFDHQKSQGWRTPCSLAMRIDGNGGKYWLFCEYGTQEWGTGGVGAFEGERYQTTPTPPYKADGTVHNWEIVYQPSPVNGDGLVTFRCDGQTWEFPVQEQHRQHGATFDRFGIWNQQTAGNSMDIYLDDLVIDGEEESFDADSGWVSDGNPATYTQRVIRPFHHFGHSMTNHAGGQTGEVGGIIFRDEQPAFYADRVGPFSLDDELFASGKVALRSAGADSGVFIGWFAGDDKRNKSTPQHVEPQTDLLGVMIEGPSRIGHFFRPAYATSQGDGDAPTNEGAPEQMPLLRPSEEGHSWSLHYEPEEADGHGRITVKLDDELRRVDLPEGLRAEGATFDRFGIFNIQSGGHHVELFLDDLSYSK